MGEIIIKKTSPTTLKGASHAPYTYHIRNLGDITLEIDMPISVLALPEETDEEAIGMKVEGNTTTINLSWTLSDEASDVVDEVSNTATADEQMAFLLGDFQASGIEHAYEFKLMPNSGSTPFYSKTGSLSKIMVSKSGTTPVTYNARITFMIANMVASMDVEESNPTT